MNLVKCILTCNDCYKSGRTIKPRGVMVHSTGANNPTVKRYVQPSKTDPNFAALRAQIGTNANGNDWNRAGVQKCVHAFIGKIADGSVATVQTLPFDFRAWHAGKGNKGSANDTHISFEICEDGLTDKAYFAKVYREAVELAAFLCKEYGINPQADGAVICHAEGHDRGTASNHGDILHWFPKHGKTMADFRADVAAEMQTAEEEEEMVYYKTIKDVPKEYKAAVQKAIDAGALAGYGGGVLNLSEDLCRTLTILDRLGQLEKIK